MEAKLQRMFPKLKKKTEITMALVQDLKLSAFENGNIETSNIFSSK